MNKIEFRINIDRFKIVLSFEKHQRNYIANSNNRNYCTTIEIINVTSAIIFFLIIMKAINVLLKWNQQNNFENQCQFGVFEFDYSNDDLTLEWLQYFIDFIKKNRVKRYIFLIIDGFDSHTTLQFF